MGPGNGAKERVGRTRKVRAFSDWVNDVEVVNETMLGSSAGVQPTVGSSEVIVSNDK